MSLSIWNLLIVGLIAIVAVWAYDKFVAGRSVFGLTLGRA